MSTNHSQGYDSAYSKEFFQRNDLSVMRWQFVPLTKRDESVSTLGQCPLPVYCKIEGNDFCMDLWKLAAVLCIPLLKCVPLSAVPSPKQWFRCLN